MSRTIRNNNGKFLRSPRTTNAKRELSFRDDDLVQYGIFSRSIHTFVSDRDDLVRSSVYENPRKK
jgi:hypothetical protein